MRRFLNQPVKKSRSLSISGQATFLCLSKMAFHSKPMMSRLFMPDKAYRGTFGHTRTDTNSTFDVFDNEHKYVECLLLTIVFPR